MTVDVDQMQTLTATFLAQWAELQAVVERAQANSDRPPREVAVEYDAVASDLSRHLFAAEVAVWPAARRSPQRRPAIDALLRASRRIEALVVEIQSMLTGEAQLSAHHLEPAQADLAAALDDYRGRELELVAGLDETLTPQQRGELASRFGTALHRAPTRPHPRAVRRLGWTHLLYRVVAHWDRFRDTLDSRHVRDLPAEQPSGERHARRSGIWGSYVLGRQLPEAEATEGRPPSPG